MLRCIPFLLSVPLQVAYGCEETFRNAGSYTHLKDDRLKTHQAKECLNGCQMLRKAAVIGSSFLTPDGKFQQPLTVSLCFSALA
ncbi:hypothetical protein GN956_G8985 [Arapaima gigas]